MLITISNTEIEGVRYAAAQLDLNYFTIPEGKNMSQVTVKHPDGKDINNTESYYFARFMLGFVERENARRELAVLQQPKNNVVVVIDPMQDYDN